MFECHWWLCGPGLSQWGVRYWDLLPAEMWTVVIFSACLVCFCFWHFYAYLFFFHPLTLASDPFIPTLLEHVSQVHTFFSCLLCFYICSLSRGVSLALLFPLRLCFGNGNYCAICSTQYKLHVKQCATYKNKHFKQYAALSHDLIT